MSRPEVGYAFFCGYLHSEALGKVTAVGLWGDECIVAGAPPAALDLAVHYFVRGSVAGCRIVLDLEIPGAPKLPPVELPTGGPKPTTNLNLNLGTIVVPEPGEIVARLRIDSDPPLEHTVRLAVRFVDRGQLASLVR